MKIYSNNKKAYYEYEILEKYEGGLVLLGSEVKSIKEGQASIKESYIRFLDSELYVIGMYIGEYSNTGYSAHELTRNKKILIPKSDTTFKENDDVVFFSETSSVKKLEKLLSIRQQYS